ncbi:MAG TPA: hypothetical protein VGF92_15070 [Stellaceae bacterium]
MAAYTVTFRFHEDSTYQTRYESFVKEASKGLWWADPTSFFAIQTDETIDALTTRLDTNTTILKDRDMFMVMDADAKSARIWGKVLDKDVFKIIPYLKAV